MRKKHQPGCPCCGGEPEVPRVICGSCSIPEADLTAHITTSNGSELCPFPYTIPMYYVPKPIRNSASVQQAPVHWVTPRFCQSQLAFGSPYYNGLYVVMYCETATSTIKLQWLSNNAQDFGPRSCSNCPHPTSALNEMYKDAGAYCQWGSSFGLAIGTAITLHSCDPLDLTSVPVSIFTTYSVQVTE